MPRTTRCPSCQNAFAMSLEHCPHCGRPSRFPNVAMADEPDERRALQQRYDQALRDASARGVEGIVRGFEAASAALSLDGNVLKSYGDCSWVLREDMIAHRASLFEENSVLFMEHHDVAIAEAHKLPRGHRAVWAERSKLCVAKLAAKIGHETTDAEFPKLLLRDGRTPEGDEFVEVHVGGPMPTTLPPTATPRWLESSTSSRSSAQTSARPPSIRP